jgi:ribosomal protein S18 acetylase RimI-like enzyme
MNTGTVKVLTNGSSICLSFYTHQDEDDLLAYLLALSDTTRKRFGPHAFNRETLQQLFTIPSAYLGLLARESGKSAVIGYCLVKNGLPDHDLPRLMSSGFNPAPGHDFSFAPSVADEWQGTGLGSLMLHFLVRHFSKIQPARFILWGGVQADNAAAVHFYRKNGFRELGTFNHNGLNYDMYLNLSRP